jgi:excinuclease ABC subunit A
MQKQTVFPIGIITHDGGVSIIRLAQKYNKALLKLDLFSHILVFINEAGRISCHITRAVHVDEKHGVVITGKLDLPDNTALYDIKAYMPCEDRVQSSISREEPPVVFDESRLGSILAAPMPALPEADLPVTYIGTFTFKEQKQQEQIAFDDGFDLTEVTSCEYLRLLWWFDRFDRKELRRTLQVNPPYENAPKCGVFATRSPVRPNLIATTVVKVLDSHTANNTIAIKGFDGFQGTHIFAALPYDPAVENVPNLYVPPHLEHWPEYVSFAEEKEFTSASKLSAADAEILRGMAGNGHGDFQLPEAAPAPQGKKGCISIIGANENNLKNVSVDIPHNKLTVITGVSGSGKSSLAFDTLFKESQHQYIDIMGGDGGAPVMKPDVQQVSGLMPAVSIEQRSLGNNPRSTVGTVTGISNQLRLLYAAIGTRHCPTCHRPIQAMPDHEIIRLVDALSADNSVSLQPFSLEEMGCAYTGEHTLIEDFLDKGNGAIVVNINDQQDYLLQTREYCFHCERIFFDMTQSMFSANNPDYMCPACKGLGQTLIPDEGMIVHNPDISILDGASRLWGKLRNYIKKPSANWMKGQVVALAIEMNVDLETPYKDLPEDFRYQLMHGSDGREVSYEYDKGGRKGIITRPVEGAYNIITRLLTNTTSTNIGLAESFLRKTTCPTCGGERLGTESRLVTIDSVRYPVAANMNILELKDWIEKLTTTLPGYKREATFFLLAGIITRAERLIDLGLSYLSLDRAVTTLSGGEGQRLRLASQFNNTLSNILYVLDEPSMGLHARDYQSLVDKLKELCTKDNTVVVVEHKQDIIQSADYIIDVGPGAGKYGGEIIACGTVDEIRNAPQSITGKYLNDGALPMRLGAFDMDARDTITLTGARCNNLKNLSVTFPRNSFICVTGVSGSGKSSLVSQTLSPAILNRLGKGVSEVGEYDSITGLDGIQEVIHVTQSSIGRTPRSTPATYTGLFDFVRDIYAKTPEAKARGYGKDHFSYNSKSGQCPACKGMGKIQYKMGFMEDIWTTCSACQGKRYKEEILEITCKGQTISEVLEMEVSEAVDVFIGNKKLAKILSILMDVGLGYIKLGQSALTLSGGEAQRIKLAKGLSQSKTNGSVYVLDEPTTGLHLEDIGKLIEIIKKLSQTNTVITIEHNLQFISQADYVIDMGPVGGDAGGFIVATGSPWEVMQNADSITGQLLGA